MATSGTAVRSCAPFLCCRSALRYSLQAHGAPGATAAGSGHSGAAAAARHSVSRRQALLRLGPDGQFRITNMGRQAVVVNDVPVRAGARRKGGRGLEEWADGAGWCEESCEEGGRAGCGYKLRVAADASARPKTLACVYRSLESFWSQAVPICDGQCLSANLQCCFARPPWCHSCRKDKLCACRTSASSR